MDQRSVTKCRVEHDGAVVELTIPIGIMLSDLLELMEQAARGAGYHFDGTLDLRGEDD